MMRFFLAFLLSLLIAPGLQAGPNKPVVQQKPPVTLESLDSIVAKAPNLDTFLANDGLVNEYFTGLQDYFGEENFSRTQYDLILGQLREIKDKVPDLKDRLWDPKQNTGETFSVQGALKTRGRTLGQSAWENYQHNKDKELATQAQPILDLSPEERTKQIDAFNTETGAKIKTLHDSPDYKAAGRVKRGELDSDLFKKLGQEASENPKTKQVAAYFARQILNDEIVKDHFNARDPDLIIDTLEKIQKNPSQFLDKDAKLNTVLMRAIRDSLPNPNQLLERQEIFPIQYIVSNHGKKIPAGSSDGKFIFKPVPRRLHGIWKGVPLGECVGGRCGYESSLTPERWATVALKDSQLHYVERGGGYLGFVEAVPGKVGDKTYATVSFGAPQMKYKILVKDSTTGKLVQTTLYSEWLTQADAKKPKDWNGFVVSKSGAINNAGVLQTVWNSTSYRLGMDVDQSGKLRFEHLDPMAADLIKAGHNRGHAEVYGGNMILDATTKQAREDQTLTLLTTVSESQIQNSDFVKNMLSDKDPKRAFAAFKYIATGDKIPDALGEPLATYLEKAFQGRDNVIGHNAISLISSRKTVPTEVFRTIVLEGAKPKSAFAAESMDLIEKFDPLAKRTDSQQSLLARIRQEHSLIDPKNPSKNPKDAYPTLHRLATQSGGADGGKTVLETLEKEYPGTDFRRVYVQTEQNRTFAQWVPHYLTTHPEELSAVAVANIKASTKWDEPVIPNALKKFKVIDEGLKNAKTREDKIRVLKALAGLTWQELNTSTTSSKYGKRFKTIVESLGHLSKEDLDAIYEATKDTHLKPDHWGREDVPRNLSKVMLSSDKTVRERAATVMMNVYHDLKMTSSDPDWMRRHRWIQRKEFVNKISELIREKKYAKLFDTKDGFLGEYEFWYRKSALEWYLEKVEVSDEELPDAIWKLANSENHKDQELARDLIQHVSRSQTMMANEEKWIGFAKRNSLFKPYVVESLSMADNPAQHSDSYWTWLEDLRKQKVTGDIDEKAVSRRSKERAFQQLKEHYKANPGARKAVGPSFYLHCAKDFARLKLSRPAGK
jgi:hypothetical protein